MLLRYECSNLKVDFEMPLLRFSCNVRNSWKIPIPVFVSIRTIVSHLSPKFNNVIAAKNSLYNCFRGVHFKIPSNLKCQCTKKVSEQRVSVNMENLAPGRRLHTT